ncbi:hypothetical protein [Bradyrhizobium sp. STM 3557]|uniref:hypothetical protein n=1 Tax=Bradyrhizobium sp. STM 3557 TaxID=578920 RepID=UPI00388CF5F9
MTIGLALRPQFGFVTKCVQIVLLIAVGSTVHFEPVQAAELWDFIRVGKDLRAAPRWDARVGRADVQIRGSQIEILAYYRPDGENTAAETGDHPDIAISGRLSADGSVFAKCKFLNTDANPVQLTGRYITRSETQIWGDRHKKITYKELVFPRPPNADFWGFISRDVADH